MVVLFQPVAGVTTHALSRYFGKPRKYRLKIAGDARILGGHGKPTGSAVHRCAGILHPLRHIFGDFRSAVQPQRRHSKPGFRKLGSDVWMPMPSCN